MGRPPLSEEENRKIKIRLINAARDIIQSKTEASLSVRSIARSSGINSALVYKHFKDIEELIMFASLDLLKEYNLKISGISGGSPEEIYIRDWELFCEIVFDQAEYIHKLFFGKHSHMMPQVIREYFDLFPEAGSTGSQQINELIYQGSITERNLILLKPVMQDKVDRDDLSMINEMTVGYFKNMLEAKIANPALDNYLLSERMVTAVRLLLRVR